MFPLSKSSQSSKNNTNSSFFNDTNQQALISNNKPTLSISVLILINELNLKKYFFFRHFYELRRQR